MTPPPPAPSPAPWGYVTPDGSVYVRSAAGDRCVGSWQAGDPAGALEFFGRRYEELAVEVDLLAARLHRGVVGPEVVRPAIAQLRTQVGSAAAVGDLDGLLARLDALRTELDAAREQRRERRQAEQAAARTAKAEIAAQAEQIVARSDWAGGVAGFRELLDRWKALPRLDRATDDELWHRFSTARTTYTRRRKQHFAELAERREDAGRVKAKLAAEAEELATSTAWGPTSGRYRDLMRQWKQAGPAPRDVDEALWKRFRAAQDTFFAARQASTTRQTAEQEANLAAKTELLAGAEALLPVRDARAARRELRALLDRWEQIGPVPTGQTRAIEARLRRVTDAIHDADRRRWQASNPEARARASDVVEQLRTTIAALREAAARARAAGDEQAAARSEEAAVSREAWLAQAERSLDDLSG